MYAPRETGSHGRSAPKQSVCINILLIPPCLQLWTHFTINLVCISIQDQNMYNSEPDIAVRGKERTGRALDQSNKTGAANSHLVSLHVVPLVVKLLLTIAISNC